MKRLMVPLLIVLLAVTGGLAAGKILRPPPPDATVADDGKAEEHVGTTPADPGKHGGDGDVMPEYVKLNNQFVVPVVEDGRVRSLVILSLSLEVAPGSTEAVYVREPKLRDGFLQVLYDHANSGGFKGTFTDGANLVVLRKSLLEVAHRTIGQVVSDVLISDMARQDS